MARQKIAKADNPLTTAQRLGSLLKSARDIMRKDKGLNGDLDRLPMLTWLMFLKFLDDHEQVLETESLLRKQKHRPAVEPPYRWRDWAAKEDGITGDELRKFINNEEVTQHDGSKGPGLIAYLRSFAGSANPRQRVIGEVFAGVTNRICARIKQELVTRFNLHTIIRLPNGVFAPYTSIPTNLLFFDRSGPTGEIWYYEQPRPEGRKQYTKTQPIQFEEFAPCIAWWKKRKENERAWKVPAAQVLENGCNLDIKNPNAKEDFEHLPPEQLADDILQKELRIAEIMREIKQLLGRNP